MAKKHAKKVPVASPKKSLDRQDRKAEIAARRKLIAKMRLKHFSQERMLETLENEYRIKISRAQLNLDIAELRKEFLKEFEHEIKNFDRKAYFKDQLKSIEHEMERMEKMMQTDESYGVSAGKQLQDLRVERDSILRQIGMLDQTNMQDGQGILMVKSKPGDKITWHTDGSYTIEVSK